MSIREKYRQFIQWQKNPHDFKTDTTQHHCLNCGEQFTGNYCPTCGQKASAGRFTWKSVRQSVLDLWGLGSRSLPYSLWQLLWRPGYLMRDYISGKMQVCFPPVKMLIVVALLVSLSGFVDTGGEEGGYMGNDWLGYVLDKILSQMQWAMLLLSLFFILPTWWVFRSAPHCERHTLPQGFFVQVLFCVQFLMFLCLGLLLLSWAGFEDQEVANLYVMLIVPVLYFIDYKQLFGYGWWGTLWRWAAMVTMGASFLLMTFILINNRVELMSADGQKLWVQLMPKLFMLLMLIVSSLTVTDVFNRKRWQQWGLWPVVLLLAGVALLTLFSVMQTMG